MPDSRQHSAIAPGSRADWQSCAVRFAVCGVFLLFFLALWSPDARGDDLYETFNAHQKHGEASVDHARWEKLLQTYLHAAEDGLNRFDYEGLKKGGLSGLESYLQALQEVDPARLTIAEQFAFWTNLYNAKTVEIVTKHFPVSSIREIRLSLNPLAGPWKAKVLRVAGSELSLDDIEHGILRAVWNDPRIHYVVNCASVGCPNLARQAYSGDRLERMLDRAARAYINSPRGVRVGGGRVTVSSLFDWYAGDFGGSVPEILDHLRKYAAPALAQRLRDTVGIDGYEYDWMLNDWK